MFTPQEVSEKTFPKAGRLTDGYQMASVDEFLDGLTEDYTALFKENATLKTKLKVLAEKVEEYRSTEDSMRATLLTAQKMAAKLVQEAQQEKETLIADARKNAAEEIARLDAQTEEAKQRLALAQQSLADFIARSNELITQQQTFLTTLPELDLAKPEEKKPEDTISDIGAEILKNFAQEELPAEETPIAEKETEESVSENILGDLGIPSDFTMTLEELKFGRNYSNED